MYRLPSNRSETGPAWRGQKWSSILLRFWERSKAPKQTAKHRTNKQTLKGIADIHLLSRPACLHLGSRLCTHVGIYVFFLSLIFLPVAFVCLFVCLFAFVVLSALVCFKNFINTHKKEAVLSACISADSRVLLFAAMSGD